MNIAVEHQLAGARKRFLLPWLGAIASSLTLAALGYALAGGIGQAQGQLPPLPKMITVAGFIWCGLVLFLRGQVLEPTGIAARLTAPDVAAVVRHLLAGYLVLWSATVVPCIIGIAQLVAGGDARMHLLLCAASVSALGYLFPAHLKLVELTEKALAILQRVSESR